MGRGSVFCRDTSLFSEEYRVGNKRRPGGTVDVNMGLDLMKQPYLSLLNSCIFFIEHTLVALLFSLHIHD